MNVLIRRLGKLMSVRLFALGLTFLQTIVLTQFLGSQVFGLLSFAMSISALLVLIFSAGLDQVLMRDTARLGISNVSSSTRWKEIFYLINNYLVPIVTFVVALGLTVSLVTEIFGEFSKTVYAAFLTLPIILVRKYLEAICQGAKKVIRSIIGSQIVYPIVMIIGAFLIWFLDLQPSANHASLIFIFASFMSMIASALFIVGTIKVIRSRRSNEGNVAILEESPGKIAIFKSGIHFSLVSLGFVLGQHIDVLLMGVFASPEDVAIVRISARVAEMAGLMRAMILLQYKPLMAEAHGKRDISKLREHANFMVAIYVITGVPITLGLFFFAEQVLLVFGDEFVEGVWVMRIYIIGVLFTLLCGPANSMLALTDNESKASKFIWIAVLINFAFDIVLIPLLGAIGCAIANMISMFVLSIMGVVTVKKVLNIDTSILGLVSRKVKLR